MATRKPLWTLLRRMPIIESDPEGRTTLLPPVVGETAIACGQWWGGWGSVYAILARPDLTSFLWSGRFPGEPRTWLDSNHLLLSRYNGVAVWKPPQKRAAWTAPAVSTVWKKQLVVFSKPDEMEIRDTRNGTTIQRVTFDQERSKFSQIAGDTMICPRDDEVTAIDLLSGKTIWAFSLSDEMGATSGRVSSFLAVLPASRNYAVLKCGATTGRVDLRTGRIQWKTRVPTIELPLVAQDRVAYLFNGHLVVLDERSGRPIVDKKNATETFYEGRPCAFGGWMVVVNEGGGIVTVDLDSGRVLGVQHQKGAQFNGCEVVDGRLVVAGFDGALWIYEPSDSGRKAKGTAKPVRRIARKKK